ncbi:apoptosis facilitator Bcl-2-like protein 14 isoform X2 [Brienomyrus brachyistius]|uniref:apoptosis facilitator Bcl-2-like protein 14 isoform X2 n=1 Tax=Brienomyrus brachyistius TaxID=42636 RepID=UPI0020B39B1C|nr:apoptosis facilitator Bcl-2-like protein 14 isoform X2 [Brienomyrus brachyistius]
MDAGAELEHTMEYKILKAYMKRRRPKGTTLEIADHDMQKVSCKRVKKRKILKFFCCVHPQTEELNPRPKKDRRVIQFRCLNGDDGAVEVADQLMKIADSVPISSIEKGDIEADGPEEDVIQEIVELLKESGDKLNEEVKNKNLAQRMQDIFDYDFFKKVTDTFLQHMGSYGNPTAKKAEIALAVEVTSRMTAMGNHPMNRVLGFGVKYLQENHSAWIQQHGGWDNAFDSNKDDEVH